MNQLEAFLLAAVVLAFFGAFLMRKIKNPYLYAVVALPGVILHEAAHLVMAYVTFANPVRVSLIPSKNSDGSWTLGSVTCANIRWYNAFPVAVAPLILFMSPYLSFHLLMDSELDYLHVGAVLILNMIITHAAFPSGQDYKIASSKLLGSFIWLVSLAYIGLSTYQIEGLSLALPGLTD
ncbi:hypothetical protein [Thiomicrorhabdus aquaedulcis]|uniref:hypothetical protein n=1 Tax=Thiomicrorhabdus aquaedulcis TaxID=2211106 RepID=UPI000FD857BA|nr:hypothetical protein [Thiomicrorhabdus aquaedulcis]